MKFLSSIQVVLETIGGARPLPEAIEARTDAAVVRAVWWLVLIALAIAFGGHNSKFVYVDF